MADDNQPETQPEDEQETGFHHQVSRRQYLEGLKAEYKTATTKEHRAAIKAELDALVAGSAPATEKAQA